MRSLGEDLFSLVSFDDTNCQQRLQASYCSVEMRGGTWTLAIGVYYHCRHWRSSAKLTSTKLQSGIDSAAFIYLNVGMKNKNTACHCPVCMEISLSTSPTSQPLNLPSRSQNGCSSAGSYSCARSRPTDAGSEPNPPLGPCPRCWVSILSSIHSPSPSGCIHGCP